MTGTILNVAAILIGGGLGVFLGKRFPVKLRETVMSCLGLFTFAYGISLFLKTENSLIVLTSLLVGILIGEWLQIEQALENVGSWLEQRFNHSTEEGSQARFIRGFLTASLLFCIGPMAILGSIQDGLTGDYSLLAIKSTLDAFAAMAFASSLGIGVLFSAASILVYQGGITLGAAQAQAIISTQMMNEMTAVGGIILLALSLSSLLGIMKIRAGNYLPALFAAPFVVLLFNALGL